MSQEGGVEVQVPSAEITELEKNNNGPDKLTPRRRAASDLRTIAMLCHKQISKDVWGKKDPNSFVDHLRPCDVEAFALDVALRTYWELHRHKDTLAPCNISPQGTAQLRQLTLNILAEHQAALTKEHCFEVPDPVLLKQREEEKQKQIEASREATKQRTEAIKKEREERKARLEAKRQAAAAAKAATSDEGDSSSPKKPLRRQPSVAKTTTPIKIQTPPRTLTGEKQRPSMLDTLKSERKTFTRPPPKTTAATSTAEESKSPEEVSSKSYRIRPPPKCAGGAVSDGVKMNRIVPGKFMIKPPADGTKSLPSRNNALKAFQTAGAKKEKTFKRPPLNMEAGAKEEDDPIPNITLRRTLVNTEKLVPFIQNAVGLAFPLLSEAPAAASGAQFFHFSVKGPRPQNEDELAVVEHLNEYLGLPGDERFAFFGAYDGHSGKYTSLFIRSQVHAKVCRHPSFPHDMAAAIHDALLEVDQVVNDVQEREEFACGSTVLSVWVRDNRELIVGNVGDCRGFICRNGSPLEIAQPHHPDREDEKARIVSAGGAVVRRGPWRVNGILAVSRSIGDNNLKKFVIPDPDITRFALQEGDEFVVIASDGLWDVITPEQMVGIVRDVCETSGRKEVCQRLCEAALEQGSKDNVTVLLMFPNIGGAA